MDWTLDTGVPKDVVAIATITDWVVFYSKANDQIYFYSANPGMIGLTKEELLEFVRVMGERATLVQ
ncbi:MAG TPA: hypothetical protein DDW65_02545 [Firmicutes bacterium]|nr:hypothetical protein [Bacillota bacterium]